MVRNRLCHFVVFVAGPVLPVLFVVLAFTGLSTVVCVATVCLHDKRK